MLLPLTRLDFVERPSPARGGEGSGAPDFKVMKTAMTLGYVGDKTIGENLDQILLNRIRNDGTVVPSCHLIRRVGKDIVRFVLANSTEPSKLHAKDSFVSLGEGMALMSDSTEKWHYAAGGEQKGPFSVEQLTALFSAGAIHANTLVWTQKLTNWEPLARTELASLLRIGPLQPPPLASAQPMLEGAMPIQDAPVISLRQAISVCFSKYATFSGRANRPEFWYFYLFNFLVTFTAIIADFLLFGEAVASKPISPIFLIVVLALLIPNLSVTVRRLHDTDRSGWWYLILLVPIIGPIVLIVFWCQKGTPARNTYG